MESVRYNPNIQWIIPTDQEAPENLPPNCRLLPMSLQDFTQLAKHVSGVPIVVNQAYKVCDLRPLIGHMFEDLLTDFTHFGYTDLDIIYGQLSVELTPERLARFDAISSHTYLQAGHLTVVRNTRKMRTAYRRVKNWRRELANPEHCAFDERCFSNLLDPGKKRLLTRYKTLWTWMGSTPHSGDYWTSDDRDTSPVNWQWHKGRLTAETDREYAYLHFMNWRSATYRRDRAEAPWPALDTVMQTDWPTAAAQGFSVSPKGIRALAAD